MSPTGLQLARHLAQALELLKEHDKTQPAETDEIFAMLVRHIRSCRPQVLLTLAQE